MSSRSGRTVLAGVALLLAAACSPGHGEAAQAVDEFYQHLNTGDYRAAVELYDAETGAAVRGPDGAPSDLFGAWAKEETRDGKVAEIRIVSENTQGTSATVDFQIVYTGGTPERRAVSLSQVDARWKLGFIRNP